MRREIQKEDEFLSSASKTSLMACAITRARETRLWFQRQCSAIQAIHVVYSIISPGTQALPGIRDPHLLYHQLIAGGKIEVSH